MTFNRNTKPVNQNRNQRPTGRPAQKKKESTLDPKLLVKKAEPSGQQGFQSVTPFTGLKLNSVLLKNIQAKGYENMTYIQEKSILPLLDGSDLHRIPGLEKLEHFLFQLSNTPKLIQLDLRR